MYKTVPTYLTFYYKHFENAFILLSIFGRKCLNIDDNGHKNICSQG